MSIPYVPIPASVLRELQTTPALIGDTIAFFEKEVFQQRPAWHCFIRRLLGHEQQSAEMVTLPPVNAVVVSNDLGRICHDPIQIELVDWFAAQEVEL